MKFNFGSRLKLLLLSTYKAILLVSVLGCTFLIWFYYFSMVGLYVFNLMAICLFLFWSTYRLSFWLSDWSILCSCSVFPSFRSNSVNLRFFLIFPEMLCPASFLIWKYNISFLSCLCHSSYNLVCRNISNGMPTSCRIP